MSHSNCIQHKGNHVHNCKDTSFFSCKQKSLRKSEKRRIFYTFGIKCRLFHVLQLVCEGHLRSFTGKTYTRLWARLTCACGIHHVMSLIITIACMLHLHPHDFHISFTSVIHIRITLFVPSDSSISSLSFLPQSSQNFFPASIAFFRV